MRRKNITFILMICLIAAPIIATGVDPVHIPDGVEMIVWEHQNWETNGGFERLTLWSDGRSEVVVVPLRHARNGQENLRPKSGWKKVKYQSPPHVGFVRKNIYPPDVVRMKIKQALAAGIHLLKFFRPRYVDGSGTRVVIQIKGRQKEIIIPMFMDQDKGTLNHKRFLAVSKVLGGFDKSAYEVVPQ